MKDDEILQSRLRNTRVALIDMDGVLYDSMKYHTLIWHRLMTETGIRCTREEFYLYEGMTGEATIRMLWKREYGHECDSETARALYARKSRMFRNLARKEPMPGANRMLAALEMAGIRRILVTGSGQQSIIESISADYPGAFAECDRITAADVIKGKPDPEPYLKGLALAGARAEEAIVIENAPLGVRSGRGADIFTIAVTTGPIAKQAFEEEGADLIFPSMEEFAKALSACTPLPFRGMQHPVE